MTIKLNTLGDEEMERLRTFGLHGSPIPVIHVEAIAKATVKQIMEHFDALSEENQDDTEFLKAIGYYIKELREEASK